MWFVFGFFLVCFLVVAIAFYVELRLQEQEDAIFMCDPKGLRRYDDYKY